jgi:hypothetical protein
MYEIWLVMNILWELALGVWPLLLGAAVLWVVLMATALARPATRWGAGLPLAVVAGLVVAAAAFVLLPGWTRASMSDMGYWVDWVNLLGIAAGFGAVAVAFAWPLLAMRGRRHA